MNAAEWVKMMGRESVEYHRATVLERADDHPASGRAGPATPTAASAAPAVHRAQGSTTRRAHLFADGAGREPAYVAMSRPRELTRVWTVADHLPQAVEDLRRDWSTGAPRPGPSTKPYPRSPR